MRSCRLVLVLPALLVLAACASTPVAAPSSPATSPTGAPLRVCVTDDALPWASKDEANPGVEVEYGRDVAAALGRPYEQVWVTSFDQLIPSLQSGACDAIINGLYVTDDRAKLVAFSDPTWGSRFEVLMRAGESAGSLAELKGRCVATLAGSVSIDDLRRAGVKPTTFATNTEVLRAVASSDCDAAMVESPTAGWSLKSAEFSGLRTVPALTDPDTYYVAVAVDQDNTELLAQVNAAVAQIRSSGDLERILARYGVPAYLP